MRQIEIENGKKEVRQNRWIFCWTFRNLHFGLVKVVRKQCFHPVVECKSKGFFNTWWRFALREEGRSHNNSTKDAQKYLSMKCLVWISSVWCLPHVSSARFRLTCSCRMSNSSWVRIDIWYLSCQKRKKCCHSSSHFPFPPKKNRNSKRIDQTELELKTRTFPTLVSTLWARNARKFLSDFPWNYLWHKHAKSCVTTVTCWQAEQWIWDAYDLMVKVHFVPLRHLRHALT